MGVVVGFIDCSGSGKLGLVIVDVGDVEILLCLGCGFVGDMVELWFWVGLFVCG